MKIIEGEELRNNYYIWLLNNNWKREIRQLDVRFTMIIMDRRIYFKNLDFFLKMRKVWYGLRRIKRKYNEKIILISLNNFIIIYKFSKILFFEKISYILNSI